MIAKCIFVALLAAVATARPACNQVVLTTGCSSQSSPAVLVSSGLSGSSSGAVVLGSSSSGVSRNIVANGKFPVALQNCGPALNQQIPVTTSSVTAPVQEKPIVRLPASIPAPRTISHSCTCYKTILRPSVQQQIITVPSVQRYLETTHKPVVESIQYEAAPVNCGIGSSSSGSGMQVIQIGSDSSTGSVELLSAGTGSSCGPQVQVVEAPRVQTIQVPQIQTVEVPQVQVVQAPRVQTIQIPQIQTVEVPQFQVVEVPRTRAIQVPQIQTVEFPQC